MYLLCVCYRFRFKGVLVGNPYTSYSSGTFAMISTLWGLQLIPEPLWKNYVENGCDDLDNNVLLFTETCWSVLNELQSFIDNLNPYALIFPTCVPKDDLNEVQSIEIEHPTVRRQYNVGAQGRQLLKLAAKTASHLHTAKGVHLTDLTISSEGTHAIASHILTHRMNSRINNELRRDKINQVNGSGEEYTGIPYDPCTEDYTVAYLNNPAVQEALHIERSVQWDFCSDPVFESWPFMDSIADTTSLYSQLFNHPLKPNGFKIMVYSGDADGVCSTIGTQNWVYGIENSAVQSLWQTWYV